MRVSGSPKASNMTMLEISRSDHLENTASAVFATGVDAASCRCINFKFKIFLCTVHNLGAYLA